MLYHRAMAQPKENISMFSDHCNHFWCNCPPNATQKQPYLRNPLKIILHHASKGLLGGGKAAATWWSPGRTSLLLLVRPQLPPLPSPSLQFFLCLQMGKWPPSFTFVNEAAKLEKGISGQISKSNFILKGFHSVSYFLSLVSNHSEGQESCVHKPISIALIY